VYIDVIGIGLLVGWLCGGSVLNLRWLPIRALEGFLGLGALELGMWLTQNSGYPKIYTALIMGASLLMAVLLWANRHLPGIALVAIGLLLNVTVMTVNGGRMPVSAWAIARSGQGELIQTLVGGTAPRHVLMNEKTHLAFLADVIPVPPPYPRPRVISLGDLFLFAGVLWLIPYGMRKRAPAATELVGPRGITP
jgi:hypothetical protein